MFPRTSKKVKNLDSHIGQRKDIMKSSMGRLSYPHFLI